MPRKSQAWKNLEREAARELGGKRLLRGDDFSVSDTDVAIKDMEFLKIDAKYRVKHAHHSLLEELRVKYCKENSDIPVLVTKHHNQQGSYATVPTWFLGVLLQAFRDCNVDKDLDTSLAKNKILSAKGEVGQLPTPQPATPPQRLPRRPNGGVRLPRAVPVNQLPQNED